MNEEELSEWIAHTEQSINYYEKAIEGIKEPELRARYETVQKELVYKLFALESSRME